MIEKRCLTALPVYNEVNHVVDVLTEVHKYSSDILVVDDGSTDGTAELLGRQDDIQVITHGKNRGYGAALLTALQYAADSGYEFVVTIDCDGQHEPQRIPELAAGVRDVDIVSGSRYLKKFAGDSAPPTERQRINRLVTEELNRRLNLNLTDAFCGFKAYRVDAISRLCLQETGYAMPLELWVRAAQANLRIVEMPVPLIYLDEDRSFGGTLDDAQVRLDYYRLVIDRSLAGCTDQGQLCGSSPRGGQGPRMSETGLVYRRLRVPRGHGEQLIEPERSSFGSILRKNADALNASACQVHGQPLRELRQQARAELVAKATRYTRAYRDVDSFTDKRIILAGHQPQLIHPGVWYKNFELAAQARIHDAAAVQLIIDNDLCRSTSVRVPGGSVDAPIVRSIPYDQPSEAVAYEERCINDVDTFREFANRATQTIRPLVPDTILNTLWALAMEEATRNVNLGQALSRARHRLEEAWGSQTIELPFSEICDTQPFRWLTVHLLARLPQFVATYNAVVEEYRAIHRIRNHVHPVPKLGQLDDSLETPFWVWSASDKTRRALWMRKTSSAFELTDRKNGQWRLPCSVAAGERTVQALSEMWQRGVRIRPRALITTLFARMFLGDLFLHGIGGSKYDQLTDELFRRVFEIEPPGYCTLTATVLLPIPRTKVAPRDLTEIDRRLRDLRFHPERHIEATNDQVSHLVSAKKEWIAKSIARGQRLVRHQAISRINGELAAFVSDKRTNLQQKRSEIDHLLRNEPILGSREFAFCLYPEATLKACLLAKPD